MLITQLKRIGTCLPSVGKIGFYQLQQIYWRAHIRLLHSTSDVCCIGIGRVRRKFGEKDEHPGRQCNPGKPGGPSKPGGPGGAGSTRWFVGRSKKRTSPPGLVQLGQLKWSEKGEEKDDFHVRLMISLWLVCCMVDWYIWQILSVVETKRTKLVFFLCRQVKKWLEENPGERDLNRCDRIESFSMNSKVAELARLN